jgi:hypothetical protein
VNASVLKHWFITEGDEGTLDFPLITNTSTITALTIEESPPDENLEFSLIANDESVPGFTVEESGPDENLEFTAIVNDSTVTGFVVAEDEDSGDDDGSIGGRAIGGGSI